MLTENDKLILEKTVFFGHYLIYLYVAYFKISNTYIYMLYMKSFFTIKRVFESFGVDLALSES